MAKTQARLIVGVGGTLRESSATEAAIRCVLAYAQRHGAETRIFSGQALDLPMYVPGNVSTAEPVTRLISALREADAIIIGSPGYHGGISGLVKNALDYTEALANDSSPYFSNKPIGCIATGSGWQGCNTTLQALRSVVHSLRGWPTPLGIAMNTSVAKFDAAGACLVPEFDSQFLVMAQELACGVMAAEAPTRAGP